MNTVRDLLRRGDPFTREGAPDDVTIEAMRRQAVAAARVPPPRPMPLSMVFVASAAALTCVAAGAVIHLAARHNVASLDTVRSVTREADEQERHLRRVYFETRSGMQVIWQFETE